MSLQLVLSLRFKKGFYAKMQRKPRGCAASFFELILVLA